MAYESDLESLSKLLPAHLCKLIDEAARCVEVSPSAAVEECRSAVVHIVQIRELRAAIRAPGPNWHIRIKALLEKGVISPISADYMLTVLRVRDAVHYREIRASFSEAQACLAMLIAVLKAAFPIGRKVPNAV